MPEPDDPPSVTWPVWAIERVEVVHHDPAWADRGLRERDLLQELLAPWLTAAVEHVGSTAVPRLAAKPIVDLQAQVAGLDVADELVPVVAPHGWHYVSPELDRSPHRRFFVKVRDDHRVAHLHVMTAGSRWHRQLAFRDALRADPELVRAYARLKAELADRHHDDREAYTAGKRRFVQEVLARTRL
ncbi:GrpB family protein [Pseudonocardia alaniniphila]|uniref:GrpB family protein n=1 Tax=Pseudonocardia alaniniphila TaxID=75291 RepID=A0ABS9TCB5_9PSEU|nr:GrpB family protein [Pseudonocardia alaniniphila]MCH6166167.1 GrpB family protein [Pseudonocardia alaniniphila]